MQCFKANDDLTWGEQWVYLKEQLQMYDDDTVIYTHAKTAELTAVKLTSIMSCYK